MYSDFPYCTVAFIRQNLMFFFFTITPDRSLTTTHIFFFFITIFTLHLLIFHLFFLGGVPVESTSHLRYTGVPTSHACHVSTGHAEGFICPVWVYTSTYLNQQSLCISLGISVCLNYYSCYVCMYVCI